MGKLKITLVRSLIGRPLEQRMTVQALGLKKINSSVIKEDSEQLRGMINKVSHLLRVEKI